MPLYEYRCRGCGRVEEFLLLHSEDESALVCPGCGGRDLERVLSAAVSLKRSRPAGRTCCGRQERCDTPGCSTAQGCQRR